MVTVNRHSISCPSIVITGLLRSYAVIILAVRFLSAARSQSIVCVLHKNGQGHFDNYPKCITTSSSQITSLGMVFGSLSGVLRQSERRTIGHDGGKERGLVSEYGNNRVRWYYHGDRGRVVPKERERERGQTQQKSNSMGPFMVQVMTLHGRNTTKSAILVTSTTFHWPINHRQLAEK